MEVVTDGPWENGSNGSTGRKDLGQIEKPSVRENRTGIDSSSKEERAGLGIGIFGGFGKKEGWDTHGVFTLG